MILKENSAQPNSTSNTKQQEGILKDEPFLAKTIDEILWNNRNGKD